MVSYWCVFKEFLKKLGIAIGCIGLFLVFIWGLGTICEAIAKALGPAICAALAVFVFAALFIGFIVTMLWAGWTDAKNKCEIEAMKRRKNPET